MPSFASLVIERKLGYANIIKVMDCIEQTAKKLGIEIHKAVVVLDTYYLGIKYCYEQYKDLGEIKIPFPEGLKIFDKDGSIVIEDLTKNREDAQLTIKSMAINATGVRSGDIITGVTDLSKGAIIKIVGGTVPPSKDDLDRVRMFPELWTVLINKLGSIDFFREMTLFERAVWLGSNERPGEFDVADTEVFIEILDVGNSSFLSIQDEEVTDILSGNPERDDRAWPALDIRDKFPKKPGSKARRHTLIFYLHRWRLSVAYHHSVSFSGPVYIMETCTIIDGTDLEEDIIVFDGLADQYKNTKKGYEAQAKTSLGIVLGSEITNKAPDYFNILKHHFNLQEEDLIPAIIRSCKNFTAAGYKSLLQKIIRYAPQSVIIENKPVDANIVLGVVFTLLLIDPGSFVPDIQRFVTGRESAVKRLLVTILEDSYSENVAGLLKLAILSFVAQRVTGWRLQEADYIEILGMCESALQEPRTFQHNIEKGVGLIPYVVGFERTELENTSALLDEVRSFKTDLGMARFISYNKGKFVTEGGTRPKSMEIAHCIDQHWAPEIAYFLDRGIVDQYKEIGSTPFAEIFKQIFMNVTGINSRRKGRGLSGRIADGSTQFNSNVQKAQKLVLVAKQIAVSKINKIKGVHHISTTLDISWIAGLVGPMDVPGKPLTMVTMKPDDPYQLVAIKKPSRGMKDGILEDKRIESAIASAEDILANKGVSLDKANPPIPILKKYKMKKSEDGYIFVSGKETKTWDEISNIRDDISLLTQTDITLEDALSYSGDGMQQNAFERLTVIVKDYTPKTLRRTLSYINSYRTEIEVARLSRDGGGTAQAVAIEDIGACQILLYISLLFPKALKRVEGYSSRFRVEYAPLFWKVREQIRTELVSRTESKNVKWKPVKDNSGRMLRTYQIESIEEMTEKNEKGKKGHFIWIPAGLGKTMITFSYLQNLIIKGKMPKYIIYALPESALKSIITEIEYFGFPINLLIPIKGWKKHLHNMYSKSQNKLLPLHINIIEHDHMRRVSEELISNASESIFIIDEVHKALNDTIRTSVALEISRLSVDFITMTGTPIVDSSTYKLIWWLEQIVEFEVNDKNFWVAANGMIAKKVNTGVLVDKQEVIAEMNTSETKIYNSLVPLGMGGTNARPSNKDITEAFEICYQVCDREMIKQTLGFIKEKKGVMLVARTDAHQHTLKSGLIKAGLKEKDVYILEGSIFMTDESVESGDMPDYKVVIVSKRKPEGYTLTRMRAMVTSVYPSNNATREQLEGRINRVSQHAKEVHYRIVHTGILTYVLQRHKDAASISAVLAALAKEIDMR